MKTPSIKTLKLVFGDNAKQAKDIFKMSRSQLIEGPARNRFNECYNPPETYDLRMYALNMLAECYGVESIESTQGEYASYLNTGDTYNNTIIYWRGNYRVQPIGDFVEVMERQRVYFN